MGNGHSSSNNNKLLVAGQHQFQNPNQLVAAIGQQQTRKQRSNRSSFGSKMQLNRLLMMARQKPANTNNGEQTYFVANQVHQALSSTSTPASDDSELDGGFTTTSQRRHPHDKASSQQPFNCLNTKTKATTTTSANIGQTQKHKHKHKPQASSCSPSSAGSASSSSASFHESSLIGRNQAAVDVGQLERAQQQQMERQRVMMHFDSNNNADHNGLSKPQARQQLAHLSNPTPNNQHKADAIGRHSWSTVKSISSSGGGDELASWKHNTSNQGEREFANNVVAAQQLYEWQPNNNNNNNQLDSIEFMQQTTGNQLDPFEQFYSRNLHLLTNQPTQQLDDQQQQQELNSYYNSLHYNTSRNHVVASNSAPQQRRYKWPKQQYQYLNANFDTSPNELQKQSFNTQQQTMQRVPYTSQSFNLQPISKRPQQAASLVQDNSLIYYTHNNDYSYQTNVQNYNLLQQQQTPYQVKSSNGVGSAKSTKKTSRNPLAAIFPFQQQQQQQVAPSNNKQAYHQHHSNTIHLTSSKSHQNLVAAKQISLAGGSLKRIKSSPLTAQQSSYEAMRTIDMYLIRQIARSCMDFEMEQKIDLEIRLRELASQSLLEARNEIDLLEVEKSLLTSDQRMNCYASQLEQQRKQLSNPSLSTDSGRASKSSNTTNVQQPITGDKTNTIMTTTSTSDVIGQMAQQSDGRSTSFSSLSKSSQASPVSKLSPVEGESTNLTQPHSIGSRRSQQNHNNQLAAMRRQASSSSSANTLQRRRNGLSSNNSTNTRRSKQRGERLKQSITSQSNINCNMVVDNKALLSLSELRIPLMWRDVDHFKGRGDYRRYAVFCLLKINSQIYDTQLISNVDRQLTDLTFDDVIIFEQVDHEFQLELEVYSCVYLEQFSLASTPRKLKEKLSNSVSRAMGRRLATQTASANFTKELEAYDKSYRFAMIASARLNLSDCSQTIKTYDLHLVSPEAHGRHSTSGQQLAAAFEQQTAAHHYPINGNSSGRHHSGIVTASNQRDVHKNTLPLFGHFCCKLYAKPDVFDKCVKSGYLRIATIQLPNEVKPDLEPNRGDKQRVRGRADPMSRTGSSTSNSADEPPHSAQHDTNSMLRSALAASSKLATISMSNATVHWALLRNFTLHLWQVDEQKLQQALRRGHAPQVDISCKQPFCVAIDKFTRLLRVSNSSLTIETDKGCFVIAVHNLGTATNERNTASGQYQDEIGHWLKPIEQMIYDSHIWSSALQHYPPSSSQQKSRQN